MGDERKPEDEYTAELKALFSQLVRRVGGVTPTAAYLGVSHQYVSELQNTTKLRPRPAMEQIMLLERAIREPIVTSQLARIATDGVKAADPVKEAGDVVVAATGLFEAVRNNEPVNVIRGKFAELDRELTEAKVSKIGGDAA